MNYRNDNNYRVPVNFRGGPKGYVILANGRKQPVRTRTRPIVSGGSSKPKLV